MVSKKLPAGRKERANLDPASACKMRLFLAAVTESACSYRVQSMLTTCCRRKTFGSVRMRDSSTRTLLATGSLFACSAHEAAMQDEISMSAGVSSTQSVYT